MNNKITIAAMCCAGISANPAFSMETEISGFLTTRYSQTDEAAYYQAHRDDNGINEDGSFFGTKLGINLTNTISGTLKVQSQLIAKIEDRGYTAQIDWAFLSQRLNENLSLRTGKIKFPVGLVNEYIDTGIAYPWIQAPPVIYSKYVTGPQATRESYTGVSLLWNGYSGDLNYDVDVFAGQVDLDSMTIKGMAGLTVRGNWDDVVIIQASTYAGEMKPDDPTTGMGPMMDGKQHSASMVGIKYEKNNIVAYTEAATVTMDSMNGAMNSDSWYATVGYQLGEWLPHITFEDWSQESGYGQSSTTLGLNYALSNKSVVKLGLGQIESDKFATPWSTTGGTVGMFDGALSDGSTQLVSIAIDTVF